MSSKGQGEAKEEDWQGVPAPKIEHVNCPLCDSDESALLYTLRAYYTRQPGQFTLVKCLQCELIYLNPRPTPDAMHAYYPATYQPHISWQKRASWLTQKLDEYGLWKRCQPLLALVPSGQLLDVGCGTVLGRDQEIREMAADRS